MNPHPWSTAKLARASKYSAHVYRDFTGTEPPVELTFDERFGTKPLPNHIHSEHCPCRKKAGA